MAAIGKTKSGAQVSDPSHEVLRQEEHTLEPIFKPRSVALVGAGSIGRAILQNLVINPFGGTLYPVSSKHSNVLGVRAYPSLRNLPELVDLVVVTTPAETVPAVIKEAVEVGIPAAIVTSAGFKESGERGKELEAEIKQTIRGKLRLIGPNCLGVMNVAMGLNATSAKTIAHRGDVAFISQSGALCTAVLDWSLKENVGFSSFVSIGSMLDVNWGDLIDYFGSDPHTKTIAIYMESIGDARSFLSAAREVSLTKPIIVIKGGRTAAAAKAATSHTGSLTGSDDVLEAAFRRTGVLRVNSIGDIFYMTDVLAKQPRAAGRRLCIITNAGGPGVLATDALIHGGGDLAELSPKTIKELNQFLPSTWSHNNPIDIIGDADAERYAKALKIAAEDPNIDGMLVILAPLGTVNPTHIAEQLRPYAKNLGKPVLASWMGASAVSAGVNLLNQAGIPSFEFPDTAASAFNYLWKYSYNLKGIYETPQLGHADDQGSARNRASEIISSVRQTGRTVLSEYESKKLLEVYGIPTVLTEIANTKEEAIKIASSMGYPVVLKLHSLTITHKTDVGGVMLDLADAEAVGKAFEEIEEKVGVNHFHGVTVQAMALPDEYELIFGSSIDSQFGPVLLFGAGGQLVEVFNDKALALPPLNSTLARRMVEQTKIYKALMGVRDRARINMEALQELMVRFSELVVEQRWIKEIEINPLRVSSEHLVALDARILMHGLEVSAEELPKLAIRPYPAQYVSTWKMKDGKEVIIRPIRPEDEPLILQFNEKLSERSIYMRYFQPLKLSQRTAHERLTRICFVDHDREIELVVEHKTESGDREIIAAGRMSKTHGRNEAELAALVRDEFQAKGLGTELYRRMIEIAKDEGLGKVTSVMLGENREMRSLVVKQGFKLKVDLMEDLVEAELTL